MSRSRNVRPSLSREIDAGARLSRSGSKWESGALDQFEPKQVAG